MKMPKLSLMFAAALLVGLCAQSGAYAQTDEEAPPAAADQPEAPDQGVQEDTGQEDTGQEDTGQEDTGQGAPEGAQAPADQGDSTEMPPDEDTDQQPNSDK
jgi:hypothetical protein